MQDGLATSTVSDELIWVPMSPRAPRTPLERLSHIVWSLACLALVSLAGSPLAAATWTTAGLSFSDELGGTRLLAAHGTGTARDPIVLVEEIDDAGPATLVVQNFRHGRQLISPAEGFLSLSVVVIVTNGGPWRWSGFDLELRTTPDDPSVYTDGLSFDQPQMYRTAAKANRFQQAHQEDEPFDRIRFDGGSVDPRDHLRLDFDIVDANGRPVFYLVQRPIVLLAWEDLLPLSPPTMMLASKAN
jgi:hypothetical protein